MAKREAGGIRRTKLVIDPGAFPPSVQIAQFSPTEWEEFIETCCRLMKIKSAPKYASVKRLGGTGDGGRDVEARYKTNLSEDHWDLYQAKHYRGPLSPNDLFPDLAKVFGHIVNGRYPRPKTYFICAPLNVGHDLHDLLANPDEFRRRFMRDWRAGKTGLKSGRLTKKIAAYVEGFDFSCIREFLSKDLLDIHATDQVEHFKKFKIVPQRGDDPEVPSAPVGDEQVYIAELVRMYAEREGYPLTIEDVLASSTFREHFEGCRSEFYCAEGLKRFSRDIFPDEFERLLTMVYAGIRTALHHPKNKTGFSRYDAAYERIGNVSLGENKLRSSMRGGDLNGTCHHLVNEKRFTWVK